MKYHNTDIEVMVGDVVIYRDLFFRKKRAVVDYVPGVSEFDPSIIPGQWTLLRDDGLLVLLFFEPNGFAHKRVSFESRAKPENAGLKGLLPQPRFR